MACKMDEPIDGPTRRRIESRIESLKGYRLYKRKRKTA